MINISLEKEDIEFDFLSVTNCPTIIVDKAGKLLEINNPAIEVLGHNREELIGQNFRFDHATPKSNILLTRNLRRTMQGVKIEPYEIEVVTKKGAKKWFEVHSRKIKFGELPANVTTFFEVTERKSIENNLKESEKIYRSLCEDTQVLMLILDIKGNITFVNGQIEAFGFKKEAVLGKSLLSLVTLDHRRKLVLSHMNTIAGRTVEQEVQLATPKGTVEFSYQSNPMKKDGRVVGSRVIMQDITKRKELEKELKQYSLNLKKMVDEKTEKLKKSEAKLKKYSLHLEEIIEEKTKKMQELERMAAIGELAGMIGHDLRNPLAAIRNATYFLQKKQSSLADAKGAQMLSIIDNSILHADKIINDLIDYSREINLELEQCNPKMVMEQVLTKISIPRNIELECKTKDTPSCLLDLPKIERVFLNIIKNSVDAMPNGGTLTIKSSQKNQNVEFIFIDTGIGIPSEVLPKLFTPLFTTKAQGMGFGLAICKRIIQSHGGKIRLKSRIGKGTTFTVSLPIEKKQKSLIPENIAFVNQKPVCKY